MGKEAFVTTFNNDFFMILVGRAIWSANILVIILDSRWMERTAQHFKAGFSPSFFSLSGCWEEPLNFDFDRFSFPDLYS